MGSGPGPIFCVRSLPDSVNDGSQSSQKSTFGIAGEERIPVPVPHVLDHPPSGSAECTLQILNDLGVAGHRPVEALQIAVDHKHQIVEAFSGGDPQGSKAFRFVALPVSEECKDPLVRSILEASRLCIAQKSGLVDGIDGAQSHGDGRELPEIGHQSRVGVTGDPSTFHFPAEVIELIDGQAAFKESACVHARTGVTLKKDQVSAARVVDSAEEVLLSHFVEGGCRGKGGHMSTEAIKLAVGPDHHRHRIPADQILDPLFHLFIAGIGSFLIGSDAVLVGSNGVVGCRNPEGTGVPDQAIHQISCALSSGCRVGALQRFDPLGCFLWITVRCWGLM